MRGRSARGRRALAVDAPLRGRSGPARDDRLRRAQPPLRRQHTPCLSLSSFRNQKASVKDQTRESRHGVKGASLTLGRRPGRPGVHGRVRAARERGLLAPLRGGGTERQSRREGRGGVGARQGHREGEADGRERVLLLGRRSDASERERAGVRSKPFSAHARACALSLSLSLSQSILGNVHFAQTENVMCVLTRHTHTHRWCSETRRRARRS